MTKNTALLAIDQGTTSSRAILFSPAGDILTLAQKELKLHFPHSGWVEQDANNILSDTLSVISEVCEQAQHLGLIIAAAGITNQRETTILWERKTGKPVYNAIVWQDRRTADFCAALRNQGAEKTVSQRTGLLLDPYFSATKIKWVLDNNPDLRQCAQNGDLAFGTVDCFLLWHLTNGKEHATDITNASRTALYDIHEKRWHSELLDLFDIPPALLPEVKDNDAGFGVIAPNLPGAGLKIGGMAGDQQAAMIGQSCFSPGDIKATYGTGCFILMNTGTDAKKSSCRLLTTPAYTISGKTAYALEGSVFNAGTAIQWLRDSLGLIAAAPECDALALSVENNGGVFFVPAFTGLGAPYWKPDARGMITGIGRDTRKAHIVRAALEAQAFQTRDLLSAMEKDSGVTTSSLRCDGGLTGSDFMCRFLSDILSATVEIPKVQEATAWGAACLAGLNAEIFGNLEDISTTRQTERHYTPSIPKEDANERYTEWNKTMQAVLSL